MNLKLYKASELDVRLLKLIVIHTAADGGATGAFCSGPDSARGPQEDRYTLIEQSNTLLKHACLPWIP